jgi:hypothetical protein
MRETAEGEGSCGTGGGLGPVGGDEGSRAEAPKLRRAPARRQH